MSISTNPLRFIPGTDAQASLIYGLISTLAAAAAAAGVPWYGKAVGVLMV